MAREPDGIEGMVAEAFSGASAPSQAELFEIGAGAEEAGSPLGAIARPGKPGRPAGSINKRHEALRAFYLARFKHPLVALGEIASMPAKDLAAHLDCKPIEAVELQRKVLADVLPYVESKQPVEIDAGDGGMVPVIVFRERGQPVEINGQAVGRRLSVLDDEPQEVQQLSGPARDVSHGDKSHSEASD